MKLCNICKQAADRVFAITAFDNDYETEGCEPCLTRIIKQVEVEADSNYEPSTDEVV